MLRRSLLKASVAALTSVGLGALALGTRTAKKYKLRDVEIDRWHRVEFYATEDDVRNRAYEAADALVQRYMAEREGPNDVAVGQIDFKVGWVQR